MIISANIRISRRWCIGGAVSFYKRTREENFLSGKGNKGFSLQRLPFLPEAGTGGCREGLFGARRERLSAR